MISQSLSTWKVIKMGVQVPAAEKGKVKVILTRRSFMLSILLVLYLDVRPDEVVLL